ncbi:MAG: hypothetical protein Q9214_003340 [Letrouitia sp. 1 TL-2023]
MPANREKPGRAGKRATAPGSSSTPNIVEMKNAIYARCAKQPAETIFSQSDILEMKIIPKNNLQLLLECTQRLTREGLFRLMTRRGRAVWKVVKREEAAKYKTLSPEEALVYSHIEASEREGIWTRTLQSKSNLHMTVMNRCLKTLESKNYVKQIKSAKFPSRKTYMLVGLQPSEDVTGGPFYTDGVLDEEFVHQMSYWAERYILRRSWYHPPLSGSGRMKSSHRHKNLTKKEAEDLRSAEFQNKQPGRERTKSMLPMPPGFTKYPTAAEITDAINASGLSGVAMKEAEMKQLLDILCWDGKVERVGNGGGYRAIRQVLSDDPMALENGLTEAPCGRCPVAYLCKDGGPVNASTCEYFQDWLEI